MYIFKITNNNKDIRYSDWIALFLAAKSCPRSHPWRVVLVFQGYSCRLVLALLVMHLQHLLLGGCCCVWWNSITYLLIWIVNGADHQKLTAKLENTCRKEGQHTARGQRFFLSFMSLCSQFLPGLLIIAIWSEIEPSSPRIYLSWWVSVWQNLNHTLSWIDGNSTDYSKSWLLELLNWRNFE